MPTEPSSTFIPMPSLKLGVLCCVILLVSSASWGRAEQADRGSQPWWLSSQGLQTGPKPAATPVYQGSLTQTFYTPPIVPADVQMLVPDSDRPRTQGVLASTSWLKGAFS